jgi:hypothetical protein
MSAIEQWEHDTSVKPLRWGPCVWDALFYSVSGSYPEYINLNNPKHVAIQRAFGQKMIDLRYTLPCVGCRINVVLIQKEMDNLDIFLQTRRNLMYYLYILKSKVNQKLNKPTTVTFEQVLQKYS